MFLFGFREKIRSLGRIIFPPLRCCQDLLTTRVQSLRTTRSQKYTILAGLPGRGGHLTSVCILVAEAAAFAWQASLPQHQGWVASSPALPMIIAFLSLPLLWLVEQKFAYPNADQGQNSDHLRLRRHYSLRTQRIFKIQRLAASCNLWLSAT